MTKVYLYKCVDQFNVSQNNCIHWMCTSVKQHASQTAHLSCFYMTHSNVHPNLLSLVEVGQEHNGRCVKLPHKLPEITLGVGHWRLSCNEGFGNGVALWRKWGHVQSELILLIEPYIGAWNSTEYRIPWHRWQPIVDVHREMQGATADIPYHLQACQMQGQTAITQPKRKLHLCLLCLLYYCLTLEYL